MKRYIVKPNEDLQTIVYRECGRTTFADILTIPENQAIQSDRSAHILNPGDEIWIPDRQPRVEICQSGQRHTFQIKAPTRELKLCLRAAGGPLADFPYELKLADRTLLGTTDASGFVYQQIPMAATKGILIISGTTIQLELSGLDPISTTRGLQQRLANLGYSVGTIDGIVGPKTQAAVKAFQSNYSLSVDGIPGPITRHALTEAHGS